MDEEIFRITKDMERAGDLLEMAKERIDMIKILPRDKPYKFVEEYYEIIKELLTALMYLDGYKILSHKKLIEYFADNNEIEHSEIKLVDSLRKFRNDIMYYGKKISQDFLTNNEDEINRIIKMLVNLTEKKLKQ